MRFPLRRDALRNDWWSNVTAMGSNLSVNTDRLQAALAGPLRGFAAPAAGYLKRWALLP